MNTSLGLLELPELAVDVVEPNERARKGARACELERHIKFDTAILESFSSIHWQAVVYDALVVAAAVEYCDRGLARSKMNWGRRFRVRVPVHEPSRWSDRALNAALIDALTLLTGDDWQFEFRPRRAPAETPRQSRMTFPYHAEAVIAYSDGMDSRAAYELEHKRLGHRVVRVRVGAKRQDVPKKGQPSGPFAALPYEVKVDGEHAEPSARSRGFKFALVAAIAAYLIDAPKVIVPESGQGVLAPAILPVGQGYADYRNHPTFTTLMEKFVFNLLGYRLRYHFPRLWMSKGETIREFVDNCDAASETWIGTRSCWQQSRHVSVLGTRRQCGICAACLLRRQSIHAAGLTDRRETYVWETLEANAFEEGAARGFNRSHPSITRICHCRGSSSRSLRFDQNLTAI